MLPFRICDRKSCLLWQLLCHFTYTCKRHCCSLNRTISHLSGTSWVDEKHHGWMKMLLACTPYNFVYSLWCFFSDTNLDRDSFLKSLMDDHGWVAISKVADFNRVCPLCIFCLFRDHIFVVIPFKKWFCYCMAHL